MNKDEMIELLINDEEGWYEFRKNCQTDYLDLKEADLADINFERVDLKNTNLENANLQNSSFVGANLRGANLQRTNLTNAIFLEADLKNTDLRKATIQYTELQETDLERANLQGVNLKGIDLLNTIFRKANLQDTIFIGAILVNAILESAQLQRANLKDANLREADLRKADLQETNLQGANLYEANFQEAQLLRTKFSSRAQLNALKHPLTEEQLANCFFEDEHNFYKKQAKGYVNLGGLTIKTTGAIVDNKTLAIYFKDHTSWTPRDLALFLGALHISYSNVFFLMNTEETDLERIKYILKNNAYNTPFEYEIAIQQIHSGSLNLGISKLDLSDLPKNLRIVLKTLLMLGLISTPIAYTAKTIAETNLIKEQTHHLEKARKKGMLAIPNNHVTILQENMRQQEACIEELHSNAEIHNIVAKADIKNTTVTTNPDLFVNATASLSRAYLELAKSYKTDPEITLPDVENLPKEDKGHPK